MTAAPTFDFSGAQVCITGGSNGIGLAVASGFADAGADVLVTGTRSAASEYDHAADLSRFRYAQLNMRDTEAVDALAAGLSAVDVLVSNAGANFPDGLDERTPDGFDAAIALNLLGGHRLIRGCESRLRASEHPGGAAVINVASMTAFRPAPMVPGYGAAKAAIVQMTKQLAVEWAGDGIRVNAVAPGLIDTNMTQALKSFPEMEADELAKVPMGRWGAPADLVPMFLFLASPAAAFTTGQTINIDGGYSIG